ncbi:MAG: hypothetical protein WCD88_16345 [Desulfobacterales bacterium]
MGKKRKKNRTGKKPVRIADLPQKAGAHLAAGRFRQAVDAYKALLKTDHDGYLSPLITAYEGLYRQRLEKGLLEEAAMIIDQMENLSGDSAVGAHIALNLKRENYHQAAEAAARLLSAENRFRGQEGAAADALVLAFEPMPAETVLPQGLRGDLGRVRSALKSVSGSNFQDALAVIKPIGIRSIFVSWKWLIKGLCAFYGRKDDKAVAAFGKTAPGTVPGAAAAPYLRLLRKKDCGRPAEAKDVHLVTDMCMAAGYGQMASDLARAHYLWTVQRYRDSHAHLQSMLKGFPTCVRGLELTLTELYYNAGFEMPSKTAQKYVEYLLRSAFTDKTVNPAERMWAQRSQALFIEGQMAFDEFVLEQWEKFLGLYESLSGDSPRARALVYGRLGDLFSEEMQDDNPFSFLFDRRRRNEPSLRNTELAGHCYQKSIDADPQAFPSQVAQVAFLEKIGDTPGVNRLLDKLILQFPDRKEVLFKAGVRCSARKAFVKAMGYLERTLALDPMDKVVREQFILTCIEAALQYVRKNNPEKAQALLPCALEWADVHSDNFNRGAAYLYARWTAVAHLQNDKALAGRLWDLATANRQGSELKLHFFYWIMAGAYGVLSSLLKANRKFVEKTLKGTFSAEAAIDCILTLQYACLLPGAVMVLRHKIGLVERYLTGNAPAPMTREQAGTLVGFLLSEVCQRPNIAAAYIRHRLDQTPDDALFRYYRFLALQQAEPGYGKIEDDVQELETILRLAREQNEATVILAVQKLLHEINKFTHPGGTDGSPFFDLDEDFEEDDMGAQDDDFLPFFPEPPVKQKRKPKPHKKKSVPNGPRQQNLF